MSRAGGGVVSLWGRLSGALFTVSFLAGILMMATTWEDTDGDAEIIAWFSESSHRTQQIVGGFLMVIAVVSLLVLSAAIRKRVSDNGPPDLASLVSGGSAIVLATLLAVGTTALVAVSGGIEFGDDPVPASTDVILVVQSIGFGSITLFGGIAASLLVATATLSAKNSGLFPRWLVITSFAMAAILLFSIMGVPLIALPIWTLLVSIGGFKASTETAT